MKKMHVFLIGALFVFGFTGISDAATGSFSDERVDYIYWDQKEIQTYWTGVTNKTGYNEYAPCVARIESIWECGEYAYKSQYKEFGTWLHTNNDYYVHGHSLKSRWNTYDYMIPN